MNSQLTGQYIPGASIMHRMDARAKFSGFLILIAAVILTGTIEGYLLTIPFILIIAALSRLPPEIATGSVRRMLPFFFFVFLLNVLFFESETPLWQWGIITISIDGIAQGANILLRIVLILILSNVLTLTTPPMALMAAIESLMSPLRFIGVPVGDVSMILSVAVQFIPTLLRETDDIRTAQTARGAQFESGKLLDRAKALPPLLTPIFLSAFKRADELAVAMEARGYRGGKYRTKKASQPMPVSGWLALFLCAALCALQIFLF